MTFYQCVFTPIHFDWLQFVRITFELILYIYIHIYIFVFVCFCYAFYSCYTIRIDFIYFKYAQSILTHFNLFQCILIIRFVFLVYMFRICWLVFVSVWIVSKQTATCNEKWHLHAKIQKQNEHDLLLLFFGPDWSCSIVSAVAWSAQCLPSNHILVMAVSYHSQKCEWATHDKQRKHVDIFFNKS